MIPSEVWPGEPVIVRSKQMDRKVCWNESHSFCLTGTLFFFLAVFIKINSTYKPIGSFWYYAFDAEKATLLYLPTFLDWLMGSYSLFLQYGIVKVWMGAEM